MKRAGLLLAFLLVLLVGCSSKTPKIDEYTWVMTSVQSMGGRRTGGGLWRGRQQHAGGGKADRTGL